MRNLRVLAAALLLGGLHVSPVRAAGISSSPTPVQGVPLDTPLTSTASTNTLYVDGTLGSDASGCIATGTGACLTLQAAIDKVPLLSSGVTTINVAAGTYTENPLLQGRRSFKYAPAAATSGTNYVILQGAAQTIATNITAVGASHTSTTIDGIASTTGILVGSSVTAPSGNCAACTVTVVGANSVTLSAAWSSTVASQTYSFSASGITVASVATDPDSGAAVGNRRATVTGAAWSTDQWAGYLLTGTSGTGSGSTMVVFGNTATTLELVPTSAATNAFAANSVVKLTSPSVTIAGHMVVGGGLGITLNDMAVSSDSTFHPYIYLGQAGTPTNGVNFVRSQVLDNTSGVWSLPTFASLSSYIAGPAGITTMSMADDDGGGGVISGTASYFFRMSISAALPSARLSFSQSAFRTANMSVSSGATVITFPVKFKHATSQTVTIQTGAVVSSNIACAFVNTTLTLTTNAVALMTTSYFTGGASPIGGQVNGLFMSKGATLHLVGTVTMVAETHPVTLYDNAQIIAPISNGGNFVLTCTGTSVGITIVGGAKFLYSGGTSLGSFTTCTNDLQVGDANYTSGALGTEQGITLTDGTGIIGESTTTQQVANFKLFPRAVAKRPTCAVAYRGAVFHTAGGAGVTDAYEECSKDVADVYAWRPAGLFNTAVTAGSYTNTSLTVDAQGRLTAASTGTAAAQPGPWQAFSVTGAAVSEGANLSGVYRSATAGKFDNIACNWTVAGTNGGGQTVKIAVVVDAGAELCNCSLGACDATALSVAACECGGAGGTSFLASTNYAVQVKSTTDCTVNPVNINCHVEAKP